MSATVVRGVRAGDRAAWSRLYRGYRSFYELAPDDAIVARVWDWLMDDGHELHCLVAEVDGDLRGLANHRRVASPSSGDYGLWLDDLFTDPQHRGGGVGRALLAALGALASEQGLSLVSWITDERNATARRLYDGVAAATRWVTYEMDPRAAGSAAAPGSTPT